MHITVCKSYVMENSKPAKEPAITFKCMGKKLGLIEY